jgi:hypothetical protein
MSPTSGDYWKLDGCDGRDGWGRTKRVKMSLTSSASPVSTGGRQATIQSPGETSGREALPPKPKKTPLKDRVIWLSEEENDLAVDKRQPEAEVDLPGVPLPLEDRFNAVVHELDGQTSKSRVRAGRTGIGGDIQAPLNALGDVLQILTSAAPLERTQNAENRNLNPYLSPALTPTPTPSITPTPTPLIVAEPRNSQAENGRSSEVQVLRTISPFLPGPVALSRSISSRGVPAGGKLRLRDIGGAGQNGSGVKVKAKAELKSSGRDVNGSEEVDELDAEEAS